uniref:Large ribosomal subunit protein uL4c n=1 Tax=Actinocyclus sp. (in: diatoms) TaxID=1923973 RepID=A0A9E8YDS4_9STRA|nr:ribosomal protein L4 [Actinocyclus sp. (in: diatoms)]
MVDKKSFTFDVILDKNGQVIDDSKQILTLSILENSGNYLVHKDLIRQLLAKKQSTSSTKTRSEVSGGGRKPWRQKGTGRARAGSNRSPLWRGGGSIFGPKPKTIKHKLNKKERRLALKTVLAGKYPIMTTVINDFENILEKPSTKNFLQVFKNCNVELNKKTLLIVDKKSEQLKLSIRNIKNIELSSASNLNTFNLLAAEQIVLTPSALSKIQEVYGD